MKEMNSSAIQTRLGCPCDGPRVKRSVIFDTSDPTSGPLCYFHKQTAISTADVEDQVISG